MRADQFDFNLPTELIAQTPVEQRDRSRLLALHTDTGCIKHRHFYELPVILRTGDVLVLNDSKVIPARLRAKLDGRPLEILLLRENAANDWWAMLKPARRARNGQLLSLREELSAEVLQINAEGHRRLRFAGINDIRDILPLIGEMPLPPYIEADVNKMASERYQTLYARHPGSVAAPTAGLHFTEKLLKELELRGIEIVYLTLHVGPGTFAPVRTDSVENHVMHDEEFVVPDNTARAINRAKSEDRRVVAVGTTSARVLETLALRHGKIVAGPGSTNIFIYPPFQFRTVDALITNFHLPRSTLLMLVSAFASPGDISGVELILRAYKEAIAERYRFFSYGDAMFIQ